MSTATAPLSLRLSAIERIALLDLWDESLAGNHKGMHPISLPSVKEDLRGEIVWNLRDKGIIEVSEDATGQQFAFTDAGRLVFVDFGSLPDIRTEFVEAAPAPKKSGQVHGKGKKALKGGTEGAPKAPKKAPAVRSAAGPHPHRDLAKRTPGRCPVCEGSGFAKGGHECKACNMSGRKPADLIAEDKASAQMQAARRAERAKDLAEATAEAVRAEEALEGTAYDDGSCGLCSGDGAWKGASCPRCEGSGKRPAAPVATPKAKAPSAVRTATAPKAAVRHDASAKQQTDGAAPAAEPKKGAKKKEGLRKPQISILRYLAGVNMPRTRKEIAVGAKVDHAWLNSWIGSSNDAIRAKNDRDVFPSLLTLGFLRVEEFDIDGRTVSGYTITEAGRVALSKIDNPQ